MNLKLLTRVCFMIVISGTLYADPCSKIREDLNGTHIINNDGCVEKVKIKINETCDEVKFSSHLLRSDNCSYQEQPQQGLLYRLFVERESFKLGGNEFKITDGKLVQLRTATYDGTTYHYSDSSGFHRKDERGREF